MKTKIKDIFKFISTPIGIILFLGIIYRLLGISYGLPLWLIADEPSFIFGSLKMIELKTLLPSLHDEVFKGIFYYTPYISYIYLLPFVIILGAKFLFFSGSLQQFVDYSILDLSTLFISARLISVILGVLTILVVYKTAKNIFQNERIAYLSAAFLSFSILHVLFSHWARHWVPATFVFSLIIYFLSHKTWGKEKKYLLACLLAGLGIGISLQVGLLTIFILFWFLFVDKLAITKELKKPWSWQALLGFFSLSGLAYLVWPRGFYVAEGASEAITKGKTLVGLFGSYNFYLIDILNREPVFLFFIIAGFLMLFLKKRGYFLAIFSFVIFYIAIFYYLFLDVSRFILILYPLFALVAGYSLNNFLQVLPNKSQKLQAAITVIVWLALILPTSMFFSQLEDSRTAARNYFLQNIEEDTKVVVLAPLTRLPANREAVLEKEKIEPASIRKIDLAEKRLAKEYRNNKIFFALNLNEVVAKDFYSNFADYLKNNNFEYLVLDPDFAKTKGVNVDIDSLGEVIKVYNGFVNDDPVNDIPTDGSGLSFAKIWQSKDKYLGPDVYIIKLNTNE